MITSPPGTASAVLDALAAAGRAESAAVAAKHLAHLGDVLAHRLPRVRTALEQGDLDLVRARAVTDRTQLIDDPFLLAEAERRILAHVLIPGGASPADRPTPSPTRSSPPSTPPTPATTPPPF